MYAVIETGGKQYKVMVGETVDVELLPANTGDKVALDRVLLISDGENVQVGRPILENAKVSATVVGQVRGPKVIIFKYRPKQRFRHKTGHRQDYTRLHIDEIVA
jgi:large subunit ribosomal protein L21